MTGTPTVDPTADSTVDSAADPAARTRGRSTADQPFVLFLVGARLNRLTWPGRIQRINKAMSAMQQELLARPELGCVRIENWTGRTTVSVQYWRTREELMRYARSTDSEHLPAWRDFNRRFAGDDAFGIWHEIHEVSSADGLYVNMAPLGLGRADLGRTDVGRADLESASTPAPV